MGAENQHFLPLWRGSVFVHLLFARFCTLAAAKTGLYLLIEFRHIQL
jgi:hypothetical protein